MIDRRAFIASLGGSLLAVPDLLAAQAPPRIRRIGFISFGSGWTQQWDAFLNGMASLGYREGQDFVMEKRFAAGHLERLPVMAAELVRIPVDVIVVAGPGPLRAAREATRTIPIVMIAGSSDPVGEGVVKSLARPGGNVTGLTYAVSPERFGKQLELLKEAAPKVSRVTALWDLDLAMYRQVWAVPLGTAARTLRLEVLEPVQVLNEAGIDAAFATIREQRADALLVTIGGPTSAYRGRIAETASRSRLPTVAAFREFTASGGLLSYGPNLSDLYRRGATYVDRILKGAKPGDLPIELPTKYELAVNLATARSLGLVIPQTLLLRADEVIQ